jgi:membrane-associated protein
MQFLADFLNIILHLDLYLNSIIREYGFLTYLLLFIVVFCETGIVATPFLPGDSLLFAAGAIAASGSLNVFYLIIIFSAAAIAGDTVNYWIGNFVGPRIFKKKDSLFFKKEYLERTHRFYEKYGGKTIVLARFIPIIRTFAPFVAGIGKMNYGRFIFYNVFGGIFWVLFFVLSGYYFGNLTIVKQNFSLVILAIIFISFLPTIVNFIRKDKG